MAVPCSNSSLWLQQQEPEDARDAALRRYSYGVALPAICCLGIIGNVLNLVVLTRRNMRGTAYIYMRGYSAAALLAILFAIPFGLRVLIYKESGRWTSLPQAFYHAHLELYLGNGCLGVGVMMLLALTVERYVSVCRPVGRGTLQRPFLGPPCLIVTLISVVTFIMYLPSAFRSQLESCVLHSQLVYHKVPNVGFQNSLFHHIYKVVLELLFKVAPTLLLAVLNTCIMVVYQRSCKRRRRMTLSRTASSNPDEDSRKFAEEHRLILLLGSTSILFLVCVSPMVILNVTLSEDNLSNFSYQVFRAIANLLEVTNYSITFYIYCLFSEDFRNTLLKTLRWPWIRGNSFSAKAFLANNTGKNHVGVNKEILNARVSAPATTTTTTTNTTHSNNNNKHEATVPDDAAQRVWRGLWDCSARHSSCGYSAANV